MRKLTKEQAEYLDDCIILVDTREQRPLEFQHRTQRATLNVGDYSIIGPDGRKFSIYIERKTLDDLIGSVIQNRERFRRELQRARKVDHFTIVVEASMFDIVTGNYRSSANPKSVMQSLISWSIEFNRGPPWFAHDRKYAERLVESLLVKYVKRVLIKEGKHE